ncbi:hypothetical protein DFR70_105188 [Nocardia tenerifensis]|uniref:Uncharacterized protein n=1 Tax=Nocardia tenerifensis TaxID=228006 RepID=A0A318K3L6_9NOCA|nr:hypothetical protein [Nocardia tenerifensis]PXX64006.1 hypothetical protein DFR70_105188 [Nocardia tenerifensis]
MSEYQYYEFVAVDRPLTESQQAQVRELSIRARITATRFVNEYQWGDFQGDPVRMVERYYDAHLYVTNWGTHRFLLKLPRTALGRDVVDQYCVGDYVTARAVGEHLLIDMTSGEYDGDWEESAEDSLSVLIGVRAELAGGDLRALYLAWLAGYGTWERDEDAFDRDRDEELEPPVPPGLGALTAAQRALAEFLRVDPDVLAVAAVASPNLAATTDDPSAVAAWISGLDVADKDGLLLRVALGESTAVRSELLRGYRGGAAQPVMAGTRTVADLLDGAARRRAERERAQAAGRDREFARQEAEYVRERERRLRRVAAEGEAVWGRVEALVETGRGRAYDEAAELLADLRELAERDGHTIEFVCCVANLRDRHARRPAFLRRLADPSITR